MKEILENKKVLLAIVVVLVASVLFGLFSLKGGTKLLNTEENKISSVEARNKETGDTLIFHKDGRVEITSKNSSLSEYWTKDKIDALFAYYEEVYSGEADIEEGKAMLEFNDDELFDTIIGGNTGGTDTGGQDISDLFNTPTPVPSSSPSSTGGSTPAPTGTPSPEGQPWCLYWRLSYCVIAYQTPSPSTGSSPVPGANILPPTCPENKLTGRTVIGNELCFDE